MADQLSVKNKRIRLLKQDITDLDVEAFVYYAREDLDLGSGFGTAIAVRGGRAVKEELQELDPIGTTEAVVTGAGKMKASYIIHAAGPKFQEQDTEGKLRATMVNALKAADAKGIKRVAFPPMGVGFYGVPRDVSARVVLPLAKEHLEGTTGIEEIVFCMFDTWEYGPFEAQLSSMAAG